MLADIFDKITWNVIWHFRPRQWKDLSRKDLKLIIDQISKRIQYPRVMLRSNYRDVISCKVYLRQIKSLDDMTYNLPLACEYAAEWVKHDSKDFEAHFTFGFLRLLSALTEDRSKAVNFAKLC